MPTISPNHSIDKPSLLHLPNDLQVNLLTYLRAYDLAAVQQTCTFYSNPELVHAVVMHFAESIYPEDFTRGFAQEAVTCGPARKPKAINNKSQDHPLKENDELYNFENLRNMEVLVVARVLNSPEPATGFFVSKSWCKTALRWLEIQQEPRSNNKTPKKLSKKKQRMRDRKLSDASPPWPNANIDILCEHHNLQRFSNSKSARARRRLLDRQAWKILKKLYPDSTQLESAVGECVQCSLEAETAKKCEADRIELEKLERKRPLANEDIRRFYTRRTGTPPQAVSETAPLGVCPLVPGKYYVLPRAWCYSWRRYIKTGEGGAPPPPPDAASLLCHAHNLALLPPHLEAYLRGDSPELLAVCPSKGTEEAVSPPPLVAVAAQVPPAPVFVPGQGPDPEVLQAMREAGFVESPNRLGRQLSLLREMEDSRRAPPPAEPTTPVAYRNEILDRENHAVVEILTEPEYQALHEEWSSRGFGLSFAIDEKTRQPVFNTTQLCRECDATGRQHQLHIKNRRRSVMRKSAEKACVPASLEY
mmetsp:Transcript_14760/g.27963  ORF Transcript_14760/g.27963 Transcript_14760/m.27963 type:complete len:532 (-) Transcript_14760:56-1651(-)